MNNYVGLLQEKCQKNQKNLPTYLDVETDSVLSLKKCICKLYKWTTEGSGNSKKNARQNAAQLMLTTIESNEGFVTKESKENTSSVSVALKIHLYADKNKKPKPLYSEKESDNGLFVVEYKFDGYTAEGKGSSKKIAKERALEDIATRFKIHDFYENYSKKKERIAQVKNSIQKLVELCQARKLPIPSFQDKAVKSDLGKTRNYVVSCLVNDLMTQSAPSFSKRNAKEQAASLMIDKLNQTTHFDTPPPGQSPIQLLEDRSDPKKYSSEKPDGVSLPEADQPSDEDHSDWDDNCSNYGNEPDNSDDFDDDCSEEQDDTVEEDNSSSEEGCDLLLPEANLSNDEAPLAKRRC